MAISEEFVFIPFAEKVTCIFLFIDKNNTGKVVISELVSLYVVFSHIIRIFKLAIDSALTI